jgi:hypothetical protein
MITEKEILNVITSLPAEEAAVELKRMYKEDVDFIFKSITLHIAEEYKDGDHKTALRDYYLTVKEIERTAEVFDESVDPEETLP